jgi:hypothetical protein
VLFFTNPNPLAFVRFAGRADASIGWSVELDRRTEDENLPLVDGFTGTEGLTGTGSFSGCPPREPKAGLTPSCVREAADFFAMALGSNLPEYGTTGEATVGVAAGEAFTETDGETVFEDAPLAFLSISAKRFLVWLGFTSFCFWLAFSFFFFHASSLANRSAFLSTSGCPESALGTCNRHLSAILS